MLAAGSDEGRLYWPRSLEALEVQYQPPTCDGDDTIWGKTWQIMRWPVGSLNGGRPLLPIHCGRC